MTVVPTKQLKVSTFQAASTSEPSVLCIEVGDHVVFVSGGPGQARVRATTDGKTLRPRRIPRRRGLRGAKFIDGELWITGEYGTLAVSTDLAETWTEIATPNSECLWDIAKDAKGNFWIGGSGKLILRGSKNRKFKVYKHKLKARDDRADPRVETVPAGVLFPLFNALWDGKTLAKVKGVTGMMAALAIAPSGTIVMVGDKGAAFRSTDGGRTFKAVKLGLKSNFNDIAVVGGGFLAVGDKGQMRRSEDDGLTWKPLASKTKLELWSIGSWGTGALVGGADGLVLRVETPGDTYWKGAKDQFAPPPIVTASFTPIQPPSDAERDRRHAELVAEAAEALAGAKLGAPRIPPDEHDAVVLEAIDSVDGYRVYGDYLQGKGDVRGEYVALAIAGHKGAKAYAKQHAAELVGTLAAPGVKLVERWGFIEGARLAYEGDWDDDPEKDDEITRHLATLLAHPGARFLKSLIVGLVSFSDNSYDEVIKILQKAPIPSLRGLNLGDFDSEESETSWSSIGDASKLWPALPNLEQLTLHSGSMKLGRLVLPKLKRLEIVTGGFTKDNLRSIEKAILPDLETLILYFGQSGYGCDITRKDLAPLLHSDRFPRLRHLGIVNTEFADELCGHLHNAPLVAQVEELDLSLGTLSDAGVRQLATFALGLRHLRQLDITRSYVSPAGIKILKKALPELELAGVKNQRYREDDEYGSRYASLGE